MNINELIQAGAKVEISFYECEDMADAYAKIKPYKQAGDEVELNKPREESELPNLRWLKIENEGYEIIAYYDVEVEEHAIS